MGDYLNYSPKEILTRARDDGYAIGAFNAANLETLKAIVQAAAVLKSPVIIESSSAETRYVGPNNFVDLGRNYQEEYGVPIMLNLDHAASDAEADIGITAGYDLIHIDTSQLPYEENIAATTRVVKKGHAQQLLVEGEIDHIVGSSQPHDEDLDTEDLIKLYTDPIKAVDFVKKTGIDILAPFFGNVHGVYKSQPDLDIKRLAEIAKATQCWLSLHGGSGIPDDQIRSAIGCGVVKINVNTELRIAYKEALLRSMQTTSEVAIYKITPPAIEAMQAVVEQKIRLFGSAGKA